MAIALELKSLVLSLKHDKITLSMTEGAKDNLSSAVRLARAYRESRIPHLFDPQSRECVAFAVQSACKNHEIPLKWALSLHDIEYGPDREEYRRGLKKHLENLPFVKEVRFEKVDDFDDLLGKMSSMAENERLLLGLHPKKRGSHLVHITGTDSRILGKGSVIVVNDIERGTRKIGKREFNRNLASGVLFNCIFFREVD